MPPEGDAGEGKRRTLSQRGSGTSVGSREEQNVSTAETLDVTDGFAPFAPEDPVEVLFRDRREMGILSMLHEELGVDTILDLARLGDLPPEYAGASTPYQREYLKRLAAEAVGVCGYLAVDDDDSESWSLPCESPVPPAVDGRPEIVNASGGRDGLSRAFAIAHVVQGARTLRDVLNSGLLYILADDPRDVASTPLIEFAEAAISELDASSAVLAALASLSPRERLLIETGVLSVARDKPTLAELGTRMGLSRERARQLRIVAERQFADQTDAAVAPLARVLRRRLPIIVRASTARKIAAACAASAPPDAAELVVAALLGAAGYELGSEWLVRDGEHTLMSELTEAIRSEAGAGHHLPNAKALALCGPLLDTSRDSDAFIREVVGMSSFHGGWIRSDSSRAKVEASLALIGRPATRAEIAELSGLPEARVGVFCSALPGVVRAGKEAWGFECWVQEPYEGVAAEIRKRIERGGGSVEIGRLTDELPRMFGVSESSVLGYVHGTARFVPGGGRVRLATDAEIDAKHHGEVEDLDGAIPLGTSGWGWKLLVEERFFRGYSAGIPFAIAAAAGLAPGDSRLVPVVGTDFEVSLIWRIDNLNRRVDLGRIAPVLTALGVAVGSELVISISPASVQFFRPDALPEEWGRSSSEPRADVDALIESLFSVRG